MRFGTGNRETILALARMARLPNLFIIILTQVLLRYAVFQRFLYEGNGDLLSPAPDFFLLVLATVLVALAGYIINDYQDVPADQLNKPGKNPFEKAIRPRTGLVAYWTLNGLAMLIAVFLGIRARSLLFGLIFPFTAILLWLYSMRYKQMLLVGNLVVAGLSALVIFMVWYSEFLYLRLNPDLFAGVLPDMKLTNLYFTGYALFAFLVSLIREIIKDMEDREGDRHVGCRTLPLVLGMTFSRNLITAVIVITVLVLGFTMSVLYNRDQNWAFWYLLAAVQAPLIFLMVKLFFAKRTDEFHFLSNLCKIIIVAGIISMQLL
jgi:4-hydroxybenzoate polyprenyltransferase